MAPYEADGLTIARYEVTDEEATLERLRAAFNPQRPNRACPAGTYTRLTVDGTLWMSDTPAEIGDLMPVDWAMTRVDGYRDTERTMLIVGLGLGVVLNRAITAHQFDRIEVVERDERVLAAVGPHYDAKAKEHDVELVWHHADVHAWRGRGCWDVGFFDIWANICADDLPEVARLRRRFKPRVGFFQAWGQTERLQSNRRVARGWAY